MEKLSIVTTSIILMARVWSNKWNYLDWCLFCFVLVSFVLYLWERWG